MTDWERPTSSSLPQERNGILIFLPLSVFGAWLAAIVFVIALTAWLPPTDGAYGSNPFGDPFVIMIMTPVAIAAGIVTWPVAYFALRDCELSRSIAVVYTITLSWIAVTTYFTGPGGLWLSVIGLLGSLVFCSKRLRLRDRSAPLVERE